MIASAQITSHDTLSSTPPAGDVSPGHHGLSMQQEHDLAALIADGDREARNRLVQANLGLVFKIALDYTGRGLEMDDLVGEGHLGLIRGAKEFDPGFGTRFSTYASYWIKEAIHYALINTTSTIRLPAHMVVLLTKWRRAERALCREAGRQPSFDEIAASLGLTAAQKALVAKAHQASRVKQDGGMIGDAGPWSPDDVIDRHGEDSPMLEADEEFVIVSRQMDCLDARERVILSLRYGLGGEQPQTLNEISRRLGVSREWARKLEIAALRKLREGAVEAEDAPRQGRRGVPIRRATAASGIRADAPDHRGSAIA